MSTTLVVASEIFYRTRELRDQALKNLHVIAQHAAKNEPETLIYAVCIPREDDGVSAWVIEEFTGEAGRVTHGSSAALDAYLAWAKEVSPLDDTKETPQKLRHLPHLSPTMHYERSSVKDHSDPYIVFADINYLPSGIDTATPYWQGVVDFGRDNEPGTLIYRICKDPKVEGRLNSFEVYESKEYLWETHVKTDAVQANIKNTTHLRSGVKHNLLKMVDGYLQK